MAARFGAALADAEARVREAEERRRLAEDATRKELELRVQAERKADEIEKKVTREFPALSANDLELARREAVAKAEAEAKGKLEAEQRAYAEALERKEAEWRKVEAEARAREAEERAFEIEERRKRAEAAARKEAELREIAEMQARQLVERFTGNLTGSLPALQQPLSKTGRNKKAIYVYSGIAVILSVGLILIIYALIQYL
jgi:membrane protein involved in colicin uptake